MLDRAIFATPKSISFTIPVFDTMMFGGDTSRWMRPSGLPCSSHRLCAYASASQTWHRMLSATGGGMMPTVLLHWRISWASVGPGTSSIAMKYVSPTRPKSYVWAMFGCLR